MDNRQLYDRIQKLDELSRVQQEWIAAVQEDIEHLIRENHDLKMENKHLKDRLDEMTNQKPEVKREKSHAKENLEKIYHQGFHICNLDYGKRRENNDECMWCLGILYNE